MIGAVASSANDLYGALLAVANPALLGRPEVAGRSGSIGEPGAVEESQALGGKSELTEEEKREVEEFEKKDREVRRHEQAHQAVAGQYARGGPSFEYETGPDGKQYAVGGEVSIDTSEVAGDPQATIQKMQVVRRAALAPANPSAKDRQVAAKAAQTEAEAWAELSRRKLHGEDSAGAAGLVPRLDTGGQASAEAAPSGSAGNVLDPQGPAPAGGGGPWAVRAFTTSTLDTAGRFLDVRA